MYYEQKIIDGVLMERYDPNGEWTMCSPQRVTERLIEKEKENAELKRQLEQANNKVIEEKNK